VVGAISIAYVDTDLQIFYDFLKCTASEDTNEVIRKSYEGLVRIA